MLVKTLQMVKCQPAHYFRFWFLTGVVMNLFEGGNLGIEVSVPCRNLTTPQNIFSVNRRRWTFTDFLQGTDTMKRLQIVCIHLCTYCIRMCKSENESDVGLIYLYSNLLGFVSLGSGDLGSYSVEN